MDFEIKTDVSKEQIEAYRVLAVDFIKKTKGWEPEEYDMRYERTLENMPVSMFNVMRYDARAKMINDGRLRENLAGEVRVFIQTEEMRAFSDYEEFKRIHEASLKNKNATKQ